MGSKTKHPEADEPLSDADILEALKASGYPFEVKLLQQFKEAGIHASISVPRATEFNGETKEIDIAAQLLKYTVVDGSMVQVELAAYVAAKKLHPPR